MSRVPRILGLLLLTLSSACSPLYVLRAGWEEAGILWRKEDIASLVADPNTDPELARKLTLVLEARKFAVSLGLNVGGSYREYSEIDREVLVWVLSASPKLQLGYYTWWFPIVGSVPYKGFFEKEDGIELAKELTDEGYDIFLRPSPAFSTLGWFDDPLLSTLLAADDIALVNTVIHELLHNTVWIKNHVAFNETLANAFGAVAAIQFFEQRDGQESPTAIAARDRWHDELVYARFIKSARGELETFYQELSSANPPQSMETRLALRDEEFTSLQAKWKEVEKSLKTNRYQNATSRMNNAVLLAQTVYLDRLWLFDQLLQKLHYSLPAYTKAIDQIRTESEEAEQDPFELLHKHLSPAETEDLAKNDLSR